MSILRIMGLNPCYLVKSVRKPPALSILSQRKLTVRARNPHALIDKHLEEVLATMSNKAKLVVEWKSSANIGAVAEFPWLPGYIIKMGIDRIEGADILRKWINANNLDLLVLPKQMVYNVPKPSHLKSFCIAEKIEGSQNRKINLSQARQIVNFLKGTRISDLKSKNLIHCRGDKIALIDTELRGFWGVRLGLHSLYGGNLLEEDARKYLEKEIEEIEKLYL